MKYLPVSYTVGSSYYFLFHHLKALFYISWFWILALTIVDAMSLHAEVRSILNYALHFLAFTYIAVGWARVAFLKDAAKYQGNFFNHFIGINPTYFIIRYISVFSITILVLGGFTYIYFAAFENPIITSPLHFWDHLRYLAPIAITAYILILGCLATYLSRLQLCLPPVAKGDNDFGFIQAWNMGKGHSFSLMMILFSTMLPYFLVTSAIMAFLKPYIYYHPLINISFLLLFHVIKVIGLCLWMGALTSSFEFIKHKIHP